MAGTFPPIARRARRIAAAAALSVGTIAAGGAASAQDFSGLYADAFFGFGLGGANDFQLGVDGGYNVDTGGLMVYGVEGELLYGTSTGQLSTTARIGAGSVVAGDVLVMGHAGIGATGTQPFYNLGVSARKDLNDDIGVRAGYEYDWNRGAGVSNGAGRLKLGILMSF